MPVEIADQPYSSGDDVFSQTVAPKGRVSIWCVSNGAAADGFKSAAAVKQHGIPFGHGSPKVVKGFEVAMRPKADGKGSEPNIVKGIGGREYVELHVDEESMIAKQQWEASISNSAVNRHKDAIRSINASNAAPDDGQGSPSDIRTRFTEQMRDELETQQILKATA